MVNRFAIPLKVQIQRKIFWSWFFLLYRASFFYFNFLKMHSVCLHIVVTYIKSNLNPFCSLIKKLKSSYAFTFASFSLSSCVVCLTSVINFRTFRRNLTTNKSLFSPYLIFSEKKGQYKFHDLHCLHFVGIICLCLL